MKIAFTMIAFITLGFSSRLNADEQELYSSSSLTAQIIAIAEDNISKIEMSAITQSRLQHFITALLEITPVKTEKAKSEEVAGAWRQLWTNTSFSATTNYQQVYQVVSKEGYYYNISETIINDVSFTSFLRGKYRPEGNQLEILFTTNTTRYGFYPEGTSLVGLVNDFEKGVIPNVQIPSPSTTKEFMANVYVDDRLRIVIGGEDIQNKPNIFIFERIEKIQP